MGDYSTSLGTLEEALDDFYDLLLSEKDKEILLDDDYSLFIEQIQDSIQKSTLNLEGMHISIQSLIGIQKILRFLPNTRSLRLYDNIIRDSGLRALLIILKAYPSLTSLNIGANDLSDGSILCFGDIIRTTHINSIQIGASQNCWQANKFSAEGLSSILSVMEETNKMVALGLSGVLSIKSKKSQSKLPISYYLANLLRKTTKLSTLDASRLRLTDDDALYLEPGFSANKSLRYLTLRENSFPKQTGIVRGITKITSLRYLNLSHCLLTHASCCVVADSLRTGWPLIHLDISENPLGSEGVAELFSALVSNSTLVELNLSHVGFNDTAMEAFQRFLENNRVLMRLDISKNYVGDSLSDVLAMTLGTQESLERLNIATCRITDEGALEIAEALAENTDLKSISLKDNFLSTPCVFEMLEILKANETLLKIDVTSNQVDKFALEGMKALCDRNKIARMDKKLYPLRKEYVRLAIQKSKIPRVLEHLRDAEKSKDVLKEEIDAMNAEHELFDEEKGGELGSLRQTISDFEQLLAEEKKSILDMNDSRVEMEEESMKRIAELKRQTDEENAKRRSIEVESERLAKGAEELLRSISGEKDHLEKEVKILEELINDIKTAMCDKQKILKYKIPTVPSNEELAARARGDWNSTVEQKTAQKTKAKKKMPQLQTVTLAKPGQPSSRRKPK